MCFFFFRRQHWGKTLLETGRGSMEDRTLLLLGGLIEHFQRERGGGGGGGGRDYWRETAERTCPVGYL